MYDSRNDNLYEEIIPAKSSKLVRLPINSQDGEVWVENQAICNCFILDCVTTVKNNRAWVEITNPSINDVIFSMDRPVEAEIFNVECESTEILSDRAKDVLSRLRTDHLNLLNTLSRLIMCS